MAKYRRRVTKTLAWQWPRERDEMPKGAVHFDPVGKAYVETAHDGQTVFLTNGDYVLPESDGVHFYPCKEFQFDSTYSLKTRADKEIGGLDAQVKQLREELEQRITVQCTVAGGCGKNLLCHSCRATARQVLAATKEKP